MTAGPRVLLMQLSERVSAKGNAYLSGWLGRASVVAFRGEPDKWGNPVWDVFVSTPEPRPEAGQERPQDRTAATHVSASGGAPANRYAQRDATDRQERGGGWRGSAYRRPAGGARRAPAADGGPLAEDGLDDLYR